MAVPTSNTFNASAFPGLNTPSAVTPVSELILGNISFLDREIPDTINFGGRQMLAVHKNIGGSRVIDAMGPDPVDIHWSGKFYTFPGVGNAAVRARAVDALRQSGQQVTLYWGSFAYQVVVYSFDAVYKNEWEIPYKIVCKVINDGPAQTYTPTLQEAVNADLQSLSAAIASQNVVTSFYQPSTGSDSSVLSTSSGGSTAITPAMISAMQNAVQVANNIVGSGDLSNLSLPDLQTVVQAFQQAYSVVQAGISIPALTTNLDAITGASALDGINSFVELAASQYSESDITILLGYLGRIIQNLSTGAG